MTTLWKVSTEKIEEIFVHDDAAAGVEGLDVDADFVKLLTKDGASQSPDGVVIAEVGDGRYSITLTPDSVGQWDLTVVQPSNLIVSKFSYYVTDDGPLSAADVRAQVVAALDTPIPGSPTADSINERVQTLDDADVPGRLPAALVGGLMNSYFDSTVLLAAISDASVMSQIAQAILDEAGAIDGKTLREATRYIAATTVHKSSGDPDGPVTFKGLDGVTDRVRSTMDADGNRTAVELDP